MAKRKTKRRNKMRDGAGVSHGASRKVRGSWAWRNRKAQRALDKALREEA